jgi:integrase/recombinase XerD
MKWENYINQYETYLKYEKNLSANTLSSYIQDINKLYTYFEIIKNIKNIETIKKTDLTNFIAWLNGFGLSERSQSRIISGIKSFFTFLYMEDYIKENPASLLSNPGVGRKIPDILSLEEIDKMLLSIDVSHYLGHRNRAIIEVLYSCGLRVSELVNLNISNIFFNEDLIRIIGKGNKQRFVPIGEVAKKEINNYLLSFRNTITPAKGHEDFLFLNRRGKQLTRVMIFTIIKDCAKNAGIKKNISPHTFRHSFATHLIDGGANLRVVQELLGHESITTTEIYTHIDRDFLRQTITEYHPRS